MCPGQPWFIPCSYRSKVNNEEQGIQKLFCDLYRPGDLAHIKISWVIQISSPKFELNKRYDLSIMQETLELEKDILILCI